MHRIANRSPDDQYSVRTCMDQSQLIQFANRKVVLVIFTKEQKSELRYVSYVTLRYAFEVTYIEKQTINVDA